MVEAAKKRNSKTILPIEEEDRIVKYAKIYNNPLRRLPSTIVKWFKSNKLFFMRMAVVLLYFMIIWFIFLF